MRRCFFLLILNMQRLSVIYLEIEKEHSFALTVNSIELQSRIQQCFSWVNSDPMLINYLSSKPFAVGFFRSSWATFYLSRNEKANGKRKENFCNCKIRLLHHLLSKRIIAFLESDFLKWRWDRNKQEFTITIQPRIEVIFQPNIEATFQILLTPFKI